MRWRCLQSSSSAEHLAAAAGVHRDTLLILAAVLCLLLCALGLAFVARCSRLCNPSAYSVDADPGDEAAKMAPRKGMEKAALESLPTVPFDGEEEEAERPECAICLAEFARGDEMRVLPPCGHGFHAGCVDAWLLSSSTCPSCRTALVVVVAPADAPPPPCCASVAIAQASTTAGPGAEERSFAVAVERGPCRIDVGAPP